MNFDIKTALGSIAPTLATMLGGPLAGAAVTALEGAFGLAPGTGADGITKVLQSGQMTPEVMASVRAADQKHAEILEQQKIDVAKLNADHEAAMATVDAGDRDSARKREISIRGITTPALAWLVVAGSVLVGGLVMLGKVDMENATQATMVGTVIGYVFSEAKQVLAYYFGSSASSDRKTELIAQSPAVPK